MEMLNLMKRVDIGEFLLRKLYTKNVDNNEKLWITSALILWVSTVLTTLSTGKGVEHPLFCG
jgi:hypothetical protein